MKYLVYALVLCGSIHSVTQAMEPVAGSNDHAKGQRKALADYSGEFVRASKHSSKRQSEEDDGIARPKGILGCCTSVAQSKEEAVTRKPLIGLQTEHLILDELKVAETEQLFSAVVNNHPKQVLCVILSGVANVNCKDGIGWAPLHYAARDRAVTIFKMLLAVKGIDINATDGLGRTVQQIIASRRDCATEEQKARCDQMVALLDSHIAGYPFAIRDNKLIEIATGNVLLNASANEKP